jgi:hypothetical protein
MYLWLASAVSPGQFPTEFAVGGTQHNGKPFSLFAPAEAVQAPPDGEGRGLVRVELIERKGDLALVRLPAPTLENGQYVTVQASELQPAPAPEPVAP